jgi:hypothetical protein
MHQQNSLRLLLLNQALETSSDAWQLLGCTVNATPHCCSISGMLLTHHAAVAVDTSFGITGNATGVWLFN